MPALVLKPGREKSLLRRHPWIFSGAVQQVDDEPVPGGTLDLISSNGEFLGRGFYSPHSQIRARVWTFDDKTVDGNFFRSRVRSSIAARNALFDPGQTDSFRLVHAESDYLPGLIVDRYADTLVMQCLTTGVEFWRETLADLLLEDTDLKKIYERSDADVRELEGLSHRVGDLRGSISDSQISIQEHGLKLDIVYDDDQFMIGEKYTKVYLWNDTAR